MTVLFRHSGGVELAVATRTEMATAETDRPLTEKELLNAQKQRLLRQQFVEYLLKQVAELTYQYNCFENGSLLAFVTVRYPVIQRAISLIGTARIAGSM